MTPLLGQREKSTSAIAMVVPSPCCTGCPLLHATDTGGITTDYKRGKHTDGAGWERPLTHVAAPADVERSGQTPR
jgi:hypothetical protein